MMQWVFVVWVLYLDDGRNGMVEEKLEGVMKMMWYVRMYD